MAKIDLKRLAIVSPLISKTKIKYTGRNNNAIVNFVDMSKTQKMKDQRKSFLDHLSLDNFTQCKRPPAKMGKAIVPSMSGTNTLSERSGLNI